MCGYQWWQVVCRASCETCGPRLYIHWISAQIVCECHDWGNTIQYSFNSKKLLTKWNSVWRWILYWCHLVLAVSLELCLWTASWKTSHDFKLCRISDWMATDICLVGHVGCSVPKCFQSNTSMQGTSRPYMSGM